MILHNWVLAKSDLLHFCICTFLCIYRLHNLHLHVLLNDWWNVTFWAWTVNRTALLQARCYTTKCISITAYLLRWLLFMFFFVLQNYIDTFIQLHSCTDIRLSHGIIYPLNCNHERIWVLCKTTFLLLTFTKSNHFHTWANRWTNSKWPPDGTNKKRHDSQNSKSGQSVTTDLTVLI